MRRQIIVLFALWKITIYIFCLALFCLGLGIVRFCSKTSMARLVIFCILSQHFFCKNLTEYLIVYAELISSQLAAKQLQTSQHDSALLLCEVCSVFVLFWNIENRDGIIGTQGSNLHCLEEARLSLLIPW